MMLGEPEAFEAERLNMAGKIDRLLKRLTWCFTRTHDRKIKYGKRNLYTHVHITIVGSTQP